MVPTSSIGLPVHGCRAITFHPPGATTSLHSTKLGDDHPASLCRPTGECRTLPFLLMCLYQSTEVLRPQPLRSCMWVPLQTSTPLHDTLPAPTTD